MDLTNNCGFILLLDLNIKNPGILINLTIAGNIYIY